MPDRANVAAAMDFEQAQRRGDIYRVGREFRCTTTSRTLLRDGVHLFCSHCGLTILSPGDPT